MRHRIYRAHLIVNPGLGEHAVCSVKEGSADLGKF